MTLQLRVRFVERAGESIQRRSLVVDQQQPVRFKRAAVDGASEDLGSDHPPQDGEQLRGTLLGHREIDRGELVAIEHVEGGARRFGGKEQVDRLVLRIRVDALHKRSA